MKLKHYSKAWLSVLTVMVMLLSAVPTAFASSCPNSTTYEHNWSGWSTVREASCTQSGEMVRSCSNCGKKESKSIGKSGHSYGKWKTVKEATCTEKGERVRKCKKCGHKDTEKIAKKAHAWGEWTILTKATAYAVGVREHTCSVCGTTEQEKFYPEGALRKGDRGEAVKNLQTLLNENGYDCGKADGIFGKKTETAVKMVEQELEIEQDGIAWPILINRIRPRKPEPQPDTDPTSEESTDAEAHGDEGEKASAGDEYDDAPEADFSYGVLEKREESVPSNGSYYVEGETVTYCFSISNVKGDNSWPMLDVQLFDNMLQGATDGCLAAFDAIIVDASESAVMNYTVTAADVERGYISNTAYATWEQGGFFGGNTGIFGSAKSNTVTVFTTQGSSEPVCLEKIIESEPANGMYYEVGEEITYLLRLSNGSSEAITDVEICDPLMGGGDTCVNRTPVLESNGTLEARFSYIVTGKDAEAGKVTSRAWANWNGTEITISDEVIAKTAKDREKRYFTLTDTAYVGEMYNQFFGLEDLDGTEGHDFYHPVEVGGDLGEIGLDFSADNFMHVFIHIKGTPTQTGCGSCMYTLKVDDDEEWVIEVEITAIDRETEELTPKDREKRYFTLTDTAYVGEEYKHSFVLNYLDESGSFWHTFYDLTKVDSDLGEIGLDSGSDDFMEVFIEVKGTPTQTGCGSCLYTMKVDDDEEWVIEVEITATERDTEKP